MKKIAYLTIDDSPTNDFVRKVDYLKSMNIPAIFFCRGDRLEELSNEIIYGIKNGFVIGNHSYDHPHFSEISIDDCKTQIKKTDAIVEKLYKKAKVNRPAKLFRFPYGDKGSGLDAELGWSPELTSHIKSIQNLLKNFGYKQPNFEDITYRWYQAAKLHEDHDVYWTYYTFDCDIAEYRKTGKINSLGYYDLNSILARMDEDVPEGCRGLNYAKSNDIILMHDYPGIEDTFIPIIERLLEKNIVFQLPKF